MNILVTGSTSFVGREIMPILAKKFNVVGIWNHSKPASQTRLFEISRNIRFVRADLRQCVNLREISGPIDAVVHIAALSRHEKTICEYFQSNVESTNNLTKICKKLDIKTCINISTISVHGDIDGGVVLETSPFTNPSPYGVSKLISERILETCGYFDRVLSLRLPSVLGLGASRHWLSGVLEKVKQNENILIYNPNGLFNNTILATDLGNFIADLLSQNWSGSHALPLGASLPIKVKDVVKLIIDLCNSTSQIDFSEGGQKPFYISSERAAQALGYQARSTVETITNYVQVSL